MPLKVYSLDASAWLRLFLGDGPIDDVLLAAAKEVRCAQASFLAPELILVEAAHALCRRRRQGDVSASEHAKIWSDMRLMPMRLVEMAPRLELAVELAEQQRLSVYDGMYLAVAVHAHAPLLTADEELSKAAARLGWLAGRPKHSGTDG